MKISAALEQSYEFACRSAACRPPTSGGTGGSSSSGGSGGGGGGSSASGEASIVGGRVQLNGKAISGKIAKRGDQYWASTIGGPKYQQTGKTRKELMAAVVREHKNAQAAKKELANPAARAAREKMSDTDFNRTQKWNPGARAEIAAVGRAKPADVKIGRDGVPKVNGKPLELYKVSPHPSGKGYSVGGFDSRSGGYTRPTRFNDLAAVRRAVSRDVNAVVDASGA
jgi:hypothetical protein